MTRYYTDCRESESVANCTVSIAADDQDELIDAVKQHVMTVHGHDDSPELRNELKKSIQVDKTA